MKLVKKKEQEPIIVAIPNTVEVKMEAIKYVAIAVAEVAKALNSVNVKTEISNCTINNAETAIKVGEI